METTRNIGIMASETKFLASRRTSQGTSQICMGRLKRKAIWYEPNQTLKSPFGPERERERERVLFNASAARMCRVKSLSPACRSICGACLCTIQAWKSHPSIYDILYLTFSVVIQGDHNSFHQHKAPKKKRLL